MVRDAFKNRCQFWGYNDIFGGKKKIIGIACGRSQKTSHFLRCLVYIDLNMVRAGVVNHPSKWDFGGYNEIQSPRRNCLLIAYEK
jgi:hypothetical protein